MQTLDANASVPVHYGTPGREPAGQGLAGTGHMGQKDVPAEVVPDLEAAGMEVGVTADGRYVIDIWPGITDVEPWLRERRSLGAFSQPDEVYAAYAAWAGERAVSRHAFDLRAQHLGYRLECVSGTYRWRGIDAGRGVSRGTVFASA